MQDSNDSDAADEVAEANKAAVKRARELLRAFKKFEQAEAEIQDNGDRLDDEE